jgi:2-phospho-L-lactate guanylyltransferase (CobY/MobA/RfbA family)
MISETPPIRVILFDSTNAVKTRLATTMKEALVRKRMKSPLMGVIIAVTPRIRDAFVMFEPIRLPTLISECFVSIEPIPKTSSGRDVPIASRKRPISLR